MKRITFPIAASATMYIPAPCRGIVSGVKAVFATTVTTSNLVTVSRSSTTVNLVTAVTTAGMVVETGVRDTTNKDLVFDPASTTTTSQVIKVVQSGGNAVAAVVTIEFDEYATASLAASEA